VDESLLVRIKKLLKKAGDSGVTPEEAASFYAKAADLLARHNLSMVDVEAAGGETEEWVDDYICGVGRWFYEHNLAYAIARDYFFVEGHFENQKSGRKYLFFFGKESNVETAKFVFLQLLEAFDRLWTDYAIRTGVPKSDRRIYIIGVCDGFRQKLQDERRAMEIERDIISGTAGGTEIVLASVAHKTLAAYNQMFPNSQPGKSKFKQAGGSQSSLDAGFADGQRLNLHRGIGGEDRKKLT
jgi:hypothetical protein